MSGYRNRFEDEVNRVGVTRIAQVLGVARNTVYNWMANGNAPLNQLLALEGLGVDLIYVLTGVRIKLGEVEPDSAGQARQDVRPYGLSEDEARLLDGYRRSSAELQEAALRLLGGTTPPPPTSPPAKIRVPSTGGPVAPVSAGSLPGRHRKRTPDENAQ